jgi:hypothetical protein
MNISSSPDNNPPVVDSDASGANVISRDAFDEGSSEENTRPQSNTTNVASMSPDSNTTLSEEERQLLAISNYSWDWIAGEYIASSQDIMDRFGQQNFTRLEPIEPGAEPFYLSDEVSVNVDRSTDAEAEVIDIETPVDAPTVNDDEEQEEEPQDDSDQQEDNSDGGSGDDDVQPEESDDEVDSSDEGSESNSTSTNSTSSNSTSTLDESSDGGSGNETSSDGLSIETSISIG